jgi:hypothetical protein
METEAMEKAGLIARYMYRDGATSQEAERLAQDEIARQERAAAIQSYLVRAISRRQS